MNTVACVSHELSAICKQKASVPDVPLAETAQCILLMSRAMHFLDAVPSLQVLAAEGCRCTACTDDGLLWVDMHA